MPCSRISRESPQYESIVFRENPLMVGRLCTPHSLRTRERRPQEAVTSARRPGIIERPIGAWWEPKNDEKIYNRTVWSGSYKRRLCRLFFRFRTKPRNLYRRRWSSERRRFVVSKVLWVPLILWNHRITFFPWFSEASSFQYCQNTSQLLLCVYLSPIDVSCTQRFIDIAVPVWPV